ncbi:peptidylprolyl isomerase [Brevundimonas sp. 2R-24]|uniref:peptidylprolyl isomerase n=1 Tax=Peiella sedimenti TaxID=3061083 RepID=A0ABT8SNC2_9CAUL|nr:peptidylprolyl isomerase [Caulobacteraceae bacterium XZ-24]
MIALVLGLLLTPPSDAPAAVIRTSAGEIVVGLDVERAPGTTCNFLRYAAAGAYDGGAFFRTVVFETDANPSQIDVVQAATPAGSDDPGFGPIPLERTRDTGLRHVSGAISMARGEPDTATSSFFIVVEDTGNLDFGGDRHPDGQGFAAFGRVLDGMDVVRAIHAMPATDEQLDQPVRIETVALLTDIPARCRG